MRETAQVAMSTLVKKAGRNVAPYLKAMMGPWLMNQCDTYPTVASAAQLAFTNSFSPHKQKDAWSFCKDNIIEVNKPFMPYPVNSFCPEIVACLLSLLHEFKCTPDYLYHGTKHFES